MSFPPIAIVGQSCVLPGALSPADLWEAVLAGRDLTSTTPEGRWRLDPARVMAGGDLKSPEKAWTDRGGYVRGFENIFDPSGFALPEQDVLALDPLVQWVLHTAREALGTAGRGRLTGVVLGNLSLPSDGLAAWSEACWLDAQGPDFLDGEARERAGVRTPDPRSRFMSGLPAELLAQALGLEAGAVALDAACASSLYALKLACDRLHDGAADVMLAGAVNRADDLFLHVGFSTLKALSPSGRSRPFHQEADGLLPAEGAAFVALKRLADAEADGDEILGLIRGIGLSNDGRASGMLVPDRAGQVRAIWGAYTGSGLSPSDIGLVECHATGTAVGDATELASLTEVFGPGEAGVPPVPIGSLKSNMGHAITVAGMAGLLKVLGALHAGVRPPMRPVDAPLPVLADGRFRLLTAAEPWPSEGPRRAALSAFGFGGNNAHVVVEEWTGNAPRGLVATERPAPVDVALVAMGARVGAGEGVADFARDLFGADSPATHAATTVSLSLGQLRFPPADLAATEPQQLRILQAAAEALGRLAPLPRERTGILIGMGCDAAIARHGLRWRLGEWLARWHADPESPSAQGWLAAARDAVCPELTAAGVVGSLPNVVANRLNAHFDLAGPSFALSAEERSGTEALLLALRALSHGELDAAVVGAVDLACEPTHAAAARAVLDPALATPGDAAVVLVLKRLADARAAGDPVLAVFPATMPQDPGLTLDLGEGEAGLTPRFGHAHAAAGLLHVAAAALAVGHGLAPRPDGAATTWLGESAARSAGFRVTTRQGIASRVALIGGDAPAGGYLPGAAPRVCLYAGTDPADLLGALATDERESEGGCRLAFVAADPEERARKRERAIAWLAAGAPAPGPGDGIHYQPAPMAGELGFVFTGAAAAYGGMGEGLFAAFPAERDQVVRRMPAMAEAAGWVFDPTHRAPAPLDRLWGASLLSQLHAAITLGRLGLKPTAALGLSSGETNAITALGAWDDLEGLYRDFMAAGSFTEELGGELRVLGDAAKEGWACWRVTEGDALNAALRAEPTVHVTIRMSPDQLVIGGPTDASRRVVEALGAGAASPLAFDVVVHGPELTPFAERWRAIHHRPTRDVPGVRFYSHATGTAYQPTADRVADALTAQALKPIDFPALVEQAYADGVRIFVEHGPQGGLAVAIRRVLGARPHLAVSLDLASEEPVRQLMQCAAALAAAGVPVDLAALDAALPAPAAAPTGPTLTFPAHAPPVVLPPLPRAAKRVLALAGRAMETPMQTMTPAPALPPVSNTSLLPRPGEKVPGRADEGAPTALQQKVPFPPGGGEGGRRPDGGAPIVRPSGVAHVPPTTQSFDPVPPPPPSALTGTFPPAMGEGNGSLDDRLSALAEIQRAAQARYLGLVSQQAQVHTQFLAQSQAAFQAYLQAPPVPMEAPAMEVASQPMPAPVAAPPPPPAAKPAPPPQAPKAAAPPPPAGPRVPTGPVYDRAQLQVLAGGRISEVFGPLFQQQDGFVRQVRMPEPPLLLADRVTGIDAVAGALTQTGKARTGTIWTETDVKWDSWYLHQGAMPAGIMIESGQADLLLISWLGADFLNQGERVYRLLGCELVYHERPRTGKGSRKGAEPPGSFRSPSGGVLPRPGETLQFDIHVDGHAKQGDIRMFFFHYDCRIDGLERLSVRNGQAGFFTDAELADSGGVLWSPEEHTLDPQARVDAPAVPAVRNAFTSAQIEAFAEGDAYACFGTGYEATLSHVRTPRIAGGRMRFLRTVTDLDPTGGPWGRGYLRAIAPVTPEDWFFAGHFKNDPCMPGTLMFEGCLQSMAFYLAALGYTLDADGWRFEPVPEETYLMRCRGQVIPSSEEMVYELFVEEVWDGPTPTLFADLLVTVDGLKAFHCKRMGLRLIPDFPLLAMQSATEIVEPKPVARQGDVVFGYHSLLSCAWGKPTDAFGPAFEAFDHGRRLPRLPGPPYHFMSRVLEIDGTLGEAKVGSTVEVEFDIDPTAWYFEENGHPVMPYCVLLEAALQPCGWLASFIGTSLRSDTDLFFRNLDGTATQLSEVTPDDGVLTTRVKLKAISQSAGMVIVSFVVDCDVAGRPVYHMDTVFGFFPKAALASQVGLPPSDAERAVLAEASEFHVDLTQDPARYCAGSARLAAPHLRMIDRVTGYWPEGGKAGLGRLRAEKDVDASEWFFKAHFFQDPVQPGSLGLEAMVQALQFYMLERGLDRGLNEPRFEAIATDVPLSWKYRGQVVPRNKTITTELEIVEVGTDDRGAFAIADAWLWVDGTRIYQGIKLGMRLVGTTGAPPPGEALEPGVEVLDPAVDTWLADHAPTWVLPALPFMSMVDRLAGAALEQHPGQVVVALEDVHVKRWVALPGGELTLKAACETTRGGAAAAMLSAWREAASTALSRFEPVATGVVRVAAGYPKAPKAWPPLADAVPQPDPYASGRLFHGPAFRILTDLALGPTGATATLSATSGAPVGTLNQVLLDGVTHAIPNDMLSQWSDRIATDQVGYPSRLTELRLYGPTPTEGTLRLEVRFDGFHEDGERFPAFRFQLVGGAGVWAEGRLVSVLFPKGPLGVAAPEDRRAFLGDRQAVRGLTLSRVEGDVTVLAVADVRGSDWLPGTLARLYGVEGDLAALARGIAVKEHLARRFDVHPAAVRLTADHAAGCSPYEPLNAYPVQIDDDGETVTVRDNGASSLDLAPVEAYWAKTLGVGDWPIADLHLGLIQRYVGTVTIEDPAAFETLRGRPAIFLANHQVGLESLLFSVIASALVGLPTAILAKAEHRDSWLGRLIAHSFAYPGVTDPEVIQFFDRADPASLLGIVSALKGDLARGARSLMVHAEGTRSLVAGEPVSQLSAAWLDLASEGGLAIVPVRFAGALPNVPLAERLEFPLGHTRQDLYFGRPLWPGELNGLPLGARKQAVLDAMNTLGPPLTDETPGPGDRDFVAELAGFRARTNVGEVPATMFKTLEHVPAPSAETKALLQAVRKGGAPATDGPAAAWLAAFADWLAGRVPVLGAEASHDG